MILPLPVTKNKFGQRVADISASHYYRQIAEEVLEAHAENLLWTDSLSDIEDDAQAEELVDVITCCVTRFKIIYEYKDFDFDNYLSTYIEDAKKYYREPADFYTDLAVAVMRSYHAAQTAKLCDYMRNAGCGYCASDFERDYEHEKYALSEIIVLCLKRLEYLGYNAEMRQELYHTVNEKNRKRGYFNG